MIAKHITSLQHPIVKHAVLLRTDPSYRKEKEGVLISGDKMIKELYEYIPFKRLFINGQAPDSFSAKEGVFHVTQEMMKKITGLKSPEIYAAELDFYFEPTLKNHDKWLIIDQVNDPGNLGTILRTALALKWSAVFLIDGSVDPFNEKSLRAAKGSTFHLPLYKGSWEEIVSHLQKTNTPILIADKEGKDLKGFVKKSSLALVLGHEGHGVNKEVTSSFEKISIAMSEKTESLNVAIAGAIMMYELR
ncbi:MAG: TrmH family RNA methyltransferase [Rhabdochlamydiaceae bacterium]